MGKSSVSMRDLYHSYVTNNQRVNGQKVRAQPDFRSHFGPYLRHPNGHKSGGSSGCIQGGIRSGQGRYFSIASLQVKRFGG